MGEGSGSCDADHASAAAADGDALGNSVDGEGGDDDDDTDAVSSEANSGSSSNLLLLAGYSLTTQPHCVRGGRPHSEHSRMRASTPEYVRAYLGVCPSTLEYARVFLRPYVHAHVYV